MCRRAANCIELLVARICWGGTLNSQQPESVLVLGLSVNQSCGFRLSQAVFRSFRFETEAFHSEPELGRAVRNYQIQDLVYNQVTEHELRREDQPPVAREISSRRTASLISCSNASSRWRVSSSAARLGSIASSAGPQNCAVHGPWKCQ